MDAKKIILPVIGTIGTIATAVLLRNNGRTKNPWKCSHYPNLSRCRCVQTEIDRFIGKAESTCQCVEVLWQNS